MASLFVVLIYSVYRCKLEKEQLMLIPKLDDWVITQGEDIRIGLKICGIREKRNDYIFRLEYEVEADFQGFKEHKKQKLIWNPQESDTIFLTEKIEGSDSYHIRLRSVVWEDLTGIYKARKILQESVSFLVMPKRYELGTMKEKLTRKNLLEQGMEYDGVRQYKDGDRISRVHWNLYAATGQLFVRKNEEEEEQRIRIGLSFSEIPKERISDYLSIFYSISFFLISQDIMQEICYGNQTFKLSSIDQYEELFTSIFCEKYDVFDLKKKDVYEIPLCENEMDLEKFLYDMEL